MMCRTFEDSQVSHHISVTVATAKRVLQNRHSRVRIQNRIRGHCARDLIENILNCIAVAKYAASVEMPSVEKHLSRYRRKQRLV